MRPAQGADSTRRTPSHDMTGIVWCSILGLLLWPLIVLLVLAVMVRL